MEEVVHPLHAADVLDEMESRIVHIEDLATAPIPMEEQAPPSTSEQDGRSEIPD